MVNATGATPVATTAAVAASPTVTIRAVGSGQAAFEQTSST